MKYTLLILALLWALGASGQIYINSFTFGAAPAANLLLDDYPNAAAAYSLRLLRTAYTGNCVQVRRASDGTLSDIGFSGNYLDTAALKTFCASTNCFVRTWYDQSGNTNNATQVTLANQPQIAASGALQYHDGEAVIWQTSGLQRMAMTSATVASIFVVAKVDVTQAYNIIIGSAADGLWYGGTTLTTSGIAIASGGVLLASTIDDTNEHLTAAHIDASTDQLFVDGVSQATGTLATFSNTLLFRAGSSAYLNGKIKELVIYSSDQLANNSGIQSNINSFYQTY